MIDDSEGENFQDDLIDLNNDIEEISTGRGRWMEEEHKKFIQGLRIFGKNWGNVANYIGTRKSD